MVKYKNKEEGFKVNVEGLNKMSDITASLPSRLDEMIEYIKTEGVAADMNRVSHEVTVLSNHVDYTIFDSAVRQGAWNVIWRIMARLCLAKQGIRKDEIYEYFSRFSTDSYKEKQLNSGESLAEFVWRHGATKNAVVGTTFGIPLSR